MIVDILELTIYSISGIVRGLINISNEYKNMKNYREIIMYNKDDKCRLLVNVKITNDILINKKYTIHYKKGFGERFYITTLIELCD